MEGMRGKVTKKVLDGSAHWRHLANTMNGSVWWLQSGLVLPFSFFWSSATVIPRVLDPLHQFSNAGSRVVSVMESGAEGPGFRSQPRRCRVTVLVKLFTPIVPLHQAAKLVASLLRVAGVTAGQAESNGSLPPGLWLTSPAGWQTRSGISSGTLRSVIEYGLPFFTNAGKKQTMKTHLTASLAHASMTSCWDGGPINLNFIPWNHRQPVIIKYTQQLYSAGRNSRNNHTGYELYIRRQWRNFVPYLWRLIFAAIL